MAQPEMQPDDSEFDDWETMDETGELDRQIECALGQTEELDEDIIRSNNDPSLQFGRVKILQNDEQRTQYTPQIKLLRRDPKDSPTESPGMGDRKPSHKSLQQREASYAEARKRIFGSATEQNGVDGCSSGENSPKIAQRSKPQTESKDMVLTRQPILPDTEGHGFAKRSSTKS